MVKVIRLETGEDPKVFEERSSSTWGILKG
jgi:hypothetical protein